MGLEVNAFLSDTAKLCQREHLESAAVCENWLVPVHKLMQAAHLPDDFISWPQVQVIGITKFYLTFQFIRQVNGRYTAFDGCGSSYIHKEGCLNGTMYGFKDASSGMSFGFLECKHSCKIPFCFILVLLDAFPIKNHINLISFAFFR